MLKQTTGKLVTAVAIGFLFVLMLSRTGSAQNYEQQYFLVKGQTTYQLTLSATPSLYDYYQQKNHQLIKGDFASFVTPYSLALIAADIRAVFSEEEEFVNAILMLVHQIPYEAVEEARYPVETIVENNGDCDLLSYVAASLIISQNLDAVLFYYEQESHMNIGVNLPNPPRDSRTTISYVDFESTRYYVAECTGEDWQQGWRVGESPPELEGAQVTVVTLENSEQVAPGQVSSSFGTLSSSSVSLMVSPSLVMEGNTVTMTGQVSASNITGTITLYAATKDDWSAIGTTRLANGSYVFSWRPVPWGQYFVKASWAGDEEFAGADSIIVSIYVLPRFLMFIGGGMIIATVVVIVVLLMYKTTHSREMEPLETALRWDTQPSS
ncbi:hypothetical protein GTO27_01885 [Candidatus Bathyarchaeota archaeon]|nr:hypothetical protein [Candidatus Bathyarchaeota archaeon]